MKVAILLLNRGCGTGGVAKEHAQYLLGQGHAVYFMHPDIGKAGRSLLFSGETRSSMALKCRERATEIYSTDVLGQKLIN